MASLKRPWVLPVSLAEAVALFVVATVVTEQLPDPFPPDSWQMALFEVVRIAAATSLASWLVGRFAPSAHRGLGVLVGLLPLAVNVGTRYLVGPTMELARAGRVPLVEPHIVLAGLLWLGLAVWTQGLGIKGRHAARAMRGAVQGTP